MTLKRVCFFPFFYCCWWIVGGAPADHRVVYLIVTVYNLLFVFVWYLTNKVYIKFGAIFISEAIDDDPFRSTIYIFHNPAHGEWNFRKIILESWMTIRIQATKKMNRNRNYYTVPSSVDCAKYMNMQCALDTNTNKTRPDEQKQHEPNIGK